MNERIRELAEQAEFSEKDLHIQGDNFQMFAELIVRDCAGLCSITASGQDAEAIEEAILKHFGVE